MSCQASLHLFLLLIRPVAGCSLALAQMHVYACVCVCVLILSPQRKNMECTACSREQDKTFRLTL